MNKLEQELLSKIESEGIESIKENSELWIFLNEKRVDRKERLIPNVSPENLEQLNEGVPSCPKCRSTEIKRFILFGKSIGCVNPKCDNFYKNK